MKLAAAIGLTILTAAALGQAVFRYRSRSGNLTATASGGLVEQLSPSRLKLTLTGKPVTITLRDKGLTLAAPAIVSDIDPRGGGTLTRAQARGSLKATRSADVMTAGGGSYNSTKEGGVLQGTGGVQLVMHPSNSRSVLTLRGASASANLAGRGFSSAKFEGGVRSEVTQANGSRLIATGRRLDWANAGRSSTLTLSGGVKVTGTSAATFGEIHNADRVTVTLDSTGQVRSVRVSQGASQ